MKRVEKPLALVEVFSSCAEEDAPLLEQLERHLSVFRHEGSIAPWHARRIVAGSDWQRECDRHLNAASLILLLISPDFLASDSHYGREMQRAMQRHHDNEAYVIPILLRPCNWEDAPFAGLQVVPRNKKAVTSWFNRDEAWTEIAKEIRMALETVERLTINTLPTAGGSRRVTHQAKLVTGSLPVSLTSLIGREQEVEEIHRLLSRPDVRLLTLTGTAGVGKTRLALEVARDLVHTFADGVHFVSLASINDPAFVIPTIAQSIGLTESGSQPLQERLKTFLRDKRQFLLLDNFEHIIEAAALLAEVLEVCQDVKILVTSREALRLRGEHQCAVLPLALPDLLHLSDDTSLAHVPSVKLFLQRAQAIRSDFQFTKGNATTIAEICLRLDGLPLAIELAAARIKLLSPQALLTRLDHRLPVLTGGARDLPPRQQTLHNTLAWSYELLTAEEQRLFRRLSVFVGGCTLDAIEAVCGALENRPGSLLDTVTALLDKSLLQQTEQEGGQLRLTMLETIREYGLECACAAGELRAGQAAHAHYFLTLAELAEPEGFHHAAWGERLEQEHGNLHAALICVFQEAGEADSHLKAASREHALRFVGALWSFWYIRCRYSEGKQWLQAALALMAEEAASPQTQETSEGKTLSHVSTQEHVQALSTRIRTKILTGAGVFEQLSNLDGALSLHEESLQISSSAGDRLGMSVALTDLAWVALRQANYERADSLAQQSLKIGRSLADPLCIAASLLALGFLALYQRKYEQARSFLEESFHLKENLDERSGCAQALSLLGYLAVLQGEYTRVMPFIAKSMKLRQEEGNTLGIAMNFFVLTELAVVQKQFHLAARLLGVRQRLIDTIELRESGLPLFIRDRITWLQTTVRAQLGEATFREMWAEGQKMDLAEVFISP